MINDKKIKIAISQFQKTYTQKHREHYLKIIDENDYDKMSSTIDNVLSTTNRANNKRSLIVGEVQSGKTLSYLYLIAKLLDSSDVDAICFLPATNNILLTQSLQRFKNVLMSNELEIHDINKIGKTSTKQDEFEIKRMLKKINSDKKQKHVFVGLKNHHQINKINDIISKSNEIKFEKVVVIEDEGDEWSFDDITKEESTKTFEALELIINKNIYHYYTITATPYAHIFVDQGTTKPDYAFRLPVSKKYSGLDFYHNKENDWYKNIISTTSVDKDEFKNQNVRDESLEEAILRFIHNCCIKHIVDGELTNNSFLFHVFDKNQEHNEYGLIIEKILERIVSDIKLKRKGIIDKLKLINKNIYLDEYKFDVNDDSFKELFYEHAKAACVQISNQEQKDFKDNISNLDFERNNVIFVGSKMLQRGVTLPNLLVTYFLNRSKDTANADTLLQRARWFGYRGNYKFLTHVYLSPELEKDFIALRDCNEDLSTRLDELEKYGYKFIENFEEQIFVSESNLRGTRLTVAKNSARTSKRSYSNLLSTSDYEAEKLFASVISGGNNLLDNKIIAKKYNGKFLDYLNDTDVIEKNYATWKSSMSFKNFIETIKMQNLELHFIILKKDEHDIVRTRVVHEGKYLNLFQGKNDNTNYPGDLFLNNIEQLSNSALILIHKLNNKDGNNGIISEEYTYKISLTLPNKIRGNFVLKDNG